MTDRELLELAAKAAGYQISFDEQVNNYYPHGYDDNGDVDEWWNPLIDDGKALRLAVKLDIYFMTVVEQGHVTARVRNGDRVGFHESMGADPCAATRRAIVRAAAEIGKAMP